METKDSVLGTYLNDPLHQLYIICFVIGQCFIHRFVLATDKQDARRKAQSVARTWSMFDGTEENDEDGNRYIWEVFSAPDSLMDEEFLEVFRDIGLLLEEVVTKSDEKPSNRIFYYPSTFCMFPF